MINVSLLLGDGLILCIIFCVIVGGSLWWNPRLWLQDFPPDIKAAIPPKTPQEQRQTVLLGLIFLPAFFGGLAWTGMRYGTDNGFLWLVVHVYLMFQIVALFDLIVIDWMGMYIVDPENPPYPGTEGAKGYRDFLFHFKGHLRGSIMALIFAPVISGIVWLLFH